VDYSLAGSTTKQPAVRPERSIDSGALVGRIDRGEVDVQLVLGERQDAWFFASLIGPTADESPTAWAINQRALTILFDFLRTSDDPIPDFERSVPVLDPETNFIEWAEVKAPTLGEQAPRRRQGS
jgi:hypothetical protein